MANDALAKHVQEVAYQTLSRVQPSLIAAIVSLLRAGETPDQIAAFAQGVGPGLSPFVVSLIELAGPASPHALEISLLRHTVGALAWLDALTDDEFAILRDQIVSVYFWHAVRRAAR